MRAERRRTPSFQWASIEEHFYHYYSTSMEIESRKSGSVFAISERFFSIRWRSLWMSSSWIIWKELRISITRRGNIWRDNRVAIDGAQGESIRSAEIWRCAVLWDIGMRFRCAVSQLARDLWWNSTLPWRSRWRELWSARNEPMWSRWVSMYEWNVHPRWILSRWRTRLSRLVR